MLHAAPVRRSVGRLVVVAGAVMAASLVGPEAAVGGPADDRAPFEVVKYVGGRFAGVAADDEHVYVGIGSRVAVLADADDAPGPRLLGISAPLPGRIKDVAVLASGAVVAGGSAALYLLSVVDPRAPALDDARPLDEPLVSLATSGGRCYALGRHVLHVVATRDPHTLEEVGTLLLPTMMSSGTQVAASGDLVFIGGGIGTVLAIDASNPTAPVVVGGLEGPVVAGSLSASGRRLYFLDRADRLDPDGNRLLGTYGHVLEVDEQPHLIDHGVVTLVPAGPPGSVFQGTHLVAVGTRIFVTGWLTAEDGHSQQGELRCWDLAHPGRAVEMSRVAQSAYADRLIAHGDRLYLGADNGAIGDGRTLSPVITVADVRDGAQPTWLGSWMLAEPGDVTAAATIGRDFVYHEDGGHTHLYDGTDPAAFVSTGFIDIDAAGAGVTRLIARENNLYALWTDVRVFDVTDRARPVAVARSDRLAGQVVPVMAVGEPHVLVAEGGPGVGPGEHGYKLVVLARRGPGDPELARVGEAVVGAMIDDIAVDGRTAYVVYREIPDGPGVVGVYDLTDPTRVTAARQLVLPDGASAKRIVVRDDLAYVLARVDLGSVDDDVIGTGLFVVDVWDPTTTHVVGSTTAGRVGSAYEPPLTGQQYELQLLGDYALLAGHEPVVRVVDIRDTAHPTEVQRIGTPDVVADLAVGGDYAHVVMAGGAVMILRATNGVPRPAGGVAFLPFVTW